MTNQIQWTAIKQLPYSIVKTHLSRIGSIKALLVKMTSLKVSGGGSQSDQAMQITADIFGVTAQRPHTFETSGLGAAINAAVGSGLHPDHKAALDRMIHPGDQFTPIAQNQQLYDQLYREVYQKMYGKLSPLYKAIRSITGYPK